MKRIRRILLIANFINFFGYSLFAPLYAIYAQNIAGDVFTIASSYGVYAIFSGISLLFFGHIMNELKHKQKIIVFGYFFLSLGAFAYLFVQNFTHLIIVQIINAIGAGIVTPVWQAVYSQNEAKGKETTEWSIYDGGNMIVVGIASFIGGYFVNLYGFKILFIVVGLIQLAGAFYSLQLPPQKK